MQEVLKRIEDLLEKVSVQGEENWRRMALAKEGLRSLRKAIEKKGADHGTGADATCNGEAEADTGAV